MRRTRGRNSKVERQLGQLTELVREMQLENRQGHARVRKEVLKEVRDLKAHGVQVANQLGDLQLAVTQLRADGLLVANHILNLGNQELSEVKGNLYDMNQTLAGFKTQLETLNAKTNRVLEQTSKVQVEEDEIQMRLAKLETKERLNTKRLQDVLPFSGIERGLQNVAPGMPGSASSDPVKKEEARKSWEQFNQPPSPPLVENAGARRVFRQASYAARMRN